MSDPHDHPVIVGLKWIIANRTKPDGSKMTMRGLARLAGLAGQHVEQIVKRRQDPSNTNLSTLKALAAAGQVRLEWLQTGEGSPDLPVVQTHVVLDHRYPNAVEAARLARADGVDEDAVKIWLGASLDADEDPSVLWWADRMRATAAERKMLRKDPAADEKRREISRVNARREMEDERPGAAEARREEQERREAAEAAAAPTPAPSTVKPTSSGRGKK